MAYSTWNSLPSGEKVLTPPGAEESQELDDREKEKRAWSIRSSATTQRTVVFAAREKLAGEEGSRDEPAQTLAALISPCAFLTILFPLAPMHTQPPLLSPCHLSFVHTTLPPKAPRLA